MTTKVKSLFKGLRYISHIFEEKEEEIQIGFPTDVKHVAHIGWDGPSANTTTWMNAFRSPTEVTSGPMQSIGQLSSKGNQDTSDRNIEISWSRRHHSTNLASPVNSPTKRGSDSSKHSRRRRSKDGSMGSPARDSSGSSRHSRRQQKSKLGPESSNQDHPAIPKSSRRKKGSTDGGSTKSSRSSRSKCQNSLSDIQFLDLGAVSESGNK